MRTVCISGPRASGKSTLIRRIRNTTLVPFLHFDHASPQLCHWWNIQKQTSIRVCIVFDEPTPSIWDSTVMTEIFQMSNDCKIDVIYTTQQLDLIPRFFRILTDMTIVCPDQSHDSLSFATLFPGEPRHWTGYEPNHFVEIQVRHADLQRQWLDIETHVIPRDPPHDAVCPITLQTISKGQYFTECTQCHNVFDYAAIAVWVKKSRSCPMCRKTSEIWKCYQ